MGESKRDLAGCFGLIVICLVIVIFLAMVKCQADFFQNITLTF